MNVSEKERKRLQGVIAALKNDRQPFWTLWREVANYFLPKRYVWLQSDKEARVRSAKNPYILDSTGTTAARILASGMMNGITSPSRPWFRLRIAGFEHEGDAIAIWSDEVVRRMLFVMAESNFYNAIAVLYLDLVTFGTAAMLIYEDDDTVIRCYNPALGEFYLGQSYRLSVDTFAREFKQSVKQLEANFGKENLSAVLQQKCADGGAGSLDMYDVTHLIEPNTNYMDSSVPAKFAFRETYWETAAMSQGRVLAQRGFNELPGIFPRWELTANDSYGTSPAMDALPDVIQLQQETKRKAQGIDKMVNPPIVADIQLEHRPTALMPNGITYVAGTNNVGAKPLYTIQAPLGEMTEDIREVQLRIRETFHNNLFNMISQLDTVRSATEIDARREEKLVMLGSVLDRFESEALSPAINRIFSIMERQGMLPPAPPEIEDAEVEIQYMSILSTAQSAVAAAPVERWAAFIGNLSPVAPEVLQVPDWPELVRNYGTDIGVQAKNMRSREDVAEASEAEQEKLAAQEAGVAGKELVDGAQVLSETDVGGGANALQQLLAAS
jgi:hypothetical protein